VSTELFDVLGTQPMLGRTFKAGEDAVGTEFVAVLSYSLWQDLGSDQQIVGKPIRLGGISRTVVGVMPRGFWFPSPEVKVWTSAQMNPQNRSGRYTLVGRLADGQTMAAMEGPLRNLADTLAANWQYPAAWDKTKNPAMDSARDFFVGDVRPALVATLAAMGVILLIACANVAALMLGQVDARSTELAVRAALGANRQRLVQQLLLESVVIGVLAGAVGAALAVAGFGVLVTSLPLGELADNARLDWTVFWASMLASLGAALLVAVVPGIAIWRGSSLQATMATTRTGGVSGRGGRLEGTLVVVQMALAVLLAAGAGLLIRSVANLRAIDPGIQIEGAAVVGATMPTTLDAAGRRQTVSRMVEQLRGMPGVTSVGAAQKIPLTGSGNNWGFTVTGRPDITGMTTAFRIVTRDYLTASGMRITRGRNFDASDRDGSDPVVIINEAMAAKLFPNDDPIGRTLGTGFERPERIVGVVSNAAEAKLTDTAVMARYMLFEHVPVLGNEVNFIIRTDREDRVAALLDLARSAIAREGTQLAVQETTSLKAIFHRALGPVGQVVTLVSLLAGLALVLGAVGVYGVISHYVSRRSRDYGIRIALGQQPGRVVRQVVGRGAALVAFGSAIGVVAALFVTKLLATLLYGVEATDPLAMAGAVVVLLAVGMLAAFVPARRASLTDPAIVLRES
jgi:predicted permease